MGSTHVAVPGHADGFRCALPILRSRCGSAGARPCFGNAALRIPALLQRQRAFARTPRRSVLAEPLVGNGKTGMEHRLVRPQPDGATRSEEHTSELQSLMRITYAVFCSKKRTHSIPTHS